MAPQGDTKTEADGLDRQPVSLVIPCQAEYVGLCRVLVGVVGGRGAMHAEDIADLKLVVTEACALFLPGLDEESSRGHVERPDNVPRSLRVDFQVVPGYWEVTVSDAEQRCILPDDPPRIPSDTGGLGLTVMRALVDRVEHTHAESGGSVIRMSKRIDIQAGYLS